MGVPTSEVGYTSAMHRSEDHVWGHWGGGSENFTVSCRKSSVDMKQSTVKFTSVGTAASSFSDKTSAVGSNEVYRATVELVRT